MCSMLCCLVWSFVVLVSIVVLCFWGVEPVS
jgi:hypothetical protein